MHAGGFSLGGVGDDLFYHFGMQFGRRSIPLVHEWRRHEVCSGTGTTWPPVQSLEI